MRGLHWFVAVVLAGPLAAAPPARSLRWDQLAGVIAGQPVVVDLNDGTNVKGVPISVEAAALALNVTSNSHPTYKRGRVSIPRAEITGLRVVTRGHGGRNGFLVGLAAGGGAAIGIGLANEKCQYIPHIIFSSGTTCTIRGAALAGVLSVLVAAPVAGYFIGRHLGRDESRITVLPE